MRITGSILGHLEATTGHAWGVELLAEAVKEASEREGLRVADIDTKLRDARNGGPIDRIEIDDAGTRVERR